MPAITFNGLNSGLDTDEIVNALVDARRAQTITPLETRGAEIELKKTTTEAISALVSSLQSSTSVFRAGNIVGKAASSSSESVLTTATPTSSAANGCYSVYVDQLAQEDRNYFQGVADTDTTTFGTGTLTIESSGVSKEVVIDGTNNTLGGIRDAINATAGIEVTASIVNDGDASNPYRLVLVSNQTGSSANITQDLGTVLTLTDDAVLNADASNIAQNAQARVNGLTVTSSTNTFSGAIPGVDFTASSVETVNPVRVEITDTFETFESQIDAFISSFNTLMDSFAQQFTYNEATNSLGVLGSDHTMKSIQNQVRSITLGIYNDMGLNDYQSLSSIGVSFDENGHLSKDSSKLQAALTDNPEEVTTLFQGDGVRDGIADSLYSYLDSLTNTADGKITKKIENYDDSMEDISELITTRTDRLASYQENLYSRFLYMEQTLTELQSQEDLLTKFAEQLTALNKSKG